MKEQRAFTTEDPGNASIGVDSNGGGMVVLQER
jgi:hypothetical protein